MIKRTFSALVVAVALLAAPAAFAQWNDRDDHHGWHHDRDRHRAVPEFDPAAAGTLAVLLGGGALFIANRRRRSK